jgi:signal transduction histidine kinase
VYPDRINSDNQASRAEVDAMGIFLAQWRGSLMAITLVTVVVMVAWRHLVPWHLSLAWCVCIVAGYLGQAWVSWRLERSTSLAEAMPQWSPRLLMAIALSAACWGIVPWMLARQSSEVLVLASLFNVLLTFCVANSPGTRPMLYSAVFPICTLTCAALLWRPELRHIGFICALLFGLILFLGIRLQVALHQVMSERHTANDLLQDLHKHQQRLLAVERERATLQEREQLLRAMHDGLGATLVTSLTLAEKGQLDPLDMAQLLRECVDEARLVVDSLDQIDHDLTTLIGSLRHRWTSRLEAAGLQLRWHAEDLPPLHWLNPPAALQVLRILQEALANVIKHAQARQLSITVRPQMDGHVSVSIQDDGIGFDVNTVHSPGRGLGHLRQRATHLGGKLLVNSQIGQGTTIELSLPLVSAQQGPKAGAIGGAAS